MYCVWQFSIPFNAGPAFSLAAICVISWQLLWHVWKVVCALHYNKYNKLNATEIYYNLV